MDMCSEPNFLRILMLVRVIIDILKISAALVLVITGMISMGKVIIDDNPDLKKALNILKNKIIIVSIVLLLPTIFDWMFFTDNVITQHMGDYSTCTTNMDLTIIQELEKEKEDKINNVAEQSKEPEEDSKIEITVSDLLKKASDFIFAFEGTMGDCPSDSSKYVARDDGFGTITIGYGVTNYAVDVAKSISEKIGSYFNFSSGDCAPKEDIDAISMKYIQNELDNASQKCQKYSVQCDDNQLTALASLAYNAGSIAAENAIKNFKSGGEAGLKEYLKTHYVKSKGNFVQGLYDRRMKEYELFVSKSFQK